MNDHIGGTMKNKKLNTLVIFALLVAVITANPVAAEKRGIAASPSLAWGNSVNVAVVDDYYSPQMGYIYPADYPNQTFSVFTPSNLSASTLTNKDTLILWAFDPGMFSSAQKSVINSWIYSGGKLIIWDSEEPYGIAGGWDYTWLPYPFSTSVPGAMGATGQGFWVVEENPLSSANPASPYYIDTAFLNNYTDAIGDSNVFTSYSTSWCVDMKAKNYLGVEGPNHLYAKYGSGLIIYSGLDWDYAGYSTGWSTYDNGSYNLKKLFKQELEVSWNLPCGVIQTGTPTLEVIKTADITSANIGDTITFSITVTNTGNDTAYNVNLTDILPAELSAAGATTFLLGNMASGASAIRTLTATVVSAPATSSYITNIANAVGRDSQQNLVAGSGNVQISIGGISTGCKSGVITTTDLNSGITATNLVSNLLGGGVAVSNVIYNGSNVAAGTFSNGAGIIGFNSGIILSSGDICNVVGPNTQDGATTNNNRGGDTDLDNLIPSYKTYDATTLEFDFVPTGNVVTFEYVFGSEEYNEYVNSNFNDVFGFFVNGINVAIIPGSSTAISINNVNGGNPFGMSASYPAYFRNNDLGDGGGSIDTELDGLTVVLTATASVNAGQKNHIKLAIADAGDYILDSDVFIKAASFSTPKLTLEPLTATNPLGSIHTLTAKLVDANGIAIPGQTITFNVTSGTNAGLKGTAATNSLGKATFNYTSTTSGTDTIIATSAGETSNQVFKTWGFSGTIVSIADVSAAQNSNVTGAILVENVTNLGAATVWLTYNQSVVNVVGVSSGNIGNVIANIDNTIGRVAMSTYSTTPLSGNVVFANVTLRAVGAANATSPLTLQVIRLADNNGVAIPNTVRSGTFSVSSAGVLKGDVNLDGNVDIVDALFVAQYSVGLRTLTSMQLIAADVSCDGNVDIVDALFIAQYSVGLRPTFNC